MPPVPVPTPGRRTLLAGLVGGVVTGLAGCGIRLEDGAPHVPFVPTRTPVPDEAGLVALASDCDRLAVLAAALPGGLAAEVAAAHRRQQAVLQKWLAARGAPVPTDAATPTAGPSTPASPTARRRALATDEGAAAARSGSHPDAPVELRPVLAALHAQRFAAAWLLLGSAPATPVAEAPADAVDRLVALLDGAVYRLEVVGARGSEADRERAARSRTALTRLRTEATDGADRPRALGHPLPFPVDGAAGARRLAVTTLDELRSDLGALVPSLVADPADGPRVVTRWLGTVEVQARRWGRPLAPFPGLT